MDSRNLELAAEFCKLVGTKDLLEYLGASTGADAEEARQKLKSRRKYMQGMQGNPKYKREALFLIKHFSALNEVLGDLEAYASDARRRAESEHLPVLEMTIRGVLAAGGLNEDQEDYLRRNAVELGISERTFEELLDRLAEEAGVSRSASGGTTPAPAPPREEPEASNLYELLGVSPDATVDEVNAAHQRRLEVLEALPDAERADDLRKKVEIARNVLSNQAARRHYDLTNERTGPPARNRDFRPQEAATAPPVRTRSYSPPQGALAATATPARLEILGDPVRPLRIGRGMSLEVIVVRNGGEQPMGGTVSSDAPWLAVDPVHLDPLRKEQEISVQVDAADLPPEASTAVVTIQTTRGERARVVFEVQSGPSTALVAGLAVAAVVLVAAGVGLALQMI